MIEIATQKIISSTMCGNMSIMPSNVSLWLYEDIPSGSVSSCSTNDSMDSCHSLKQDELGCLYDNYSNMVNDRDDDGAFHSCVDTQAGRKKVRFALSDIDDDSSLELPSCIYMYKDDSAQQSFENITDHLWWTAEEEDILYQNVKTTCRVLRSEYRDSLKRLFQCYDGIALDAPFDSSNLQSEIQNWSSLLNTSASRGLEGFVAKKFKRERQVAIRRILDYYRAARLSSEHPSCYDEYVRSYSARLSYASSIFAQQLALADSLNAI
jgi:hypothetical protein